MIYDKIYCDALTIERICFQYFQQEKQDEKFKL